MWFLMPIVVGLIAIVVGVLLLLIGERVGKALGAGATLSFLLSVIVIWAVGRLAMYFIRSMPEAYWHTTDGARLNLALFSVSLAYIFALLFGVVRLVVSRITG